MAEALDESWIGLDIEGNGFYRYPEQVCLIQISIGDTPYLVDPLDIEDMGPLGKVISEPSITKIVHSGDYDIRSLHRDYGIVFEGLFDTSIAAAFLGSKRLGLDAILKEYIDADVTKDKKLQRSDWTNRPLTREAVVYAADDVRYLGEARSVLTQRLLDKGRIEWVEEESYFFKLSGWQNKLLKFYKDNPKFILPLSRRNEVVQFVKKGLKDLSVSRTSFSWGIPVPKNSKHVIYVWLDALTNYLSALNFPDTKDILYKNFWPASLHVIGKDILRFHAIYWPAFLLAANIEPPKRVYGHGWILSGDEKMSKSKGNILDPLQIINIYGLDSLRYYLLKEVSFGNDGNISEEKLENCINSDLANNYGNLCQRVFSFIKNNCNNTVKKTKKLSETDIRLIEKTNNLTKNLRELMNDQDLNNYIKSVINISFLTNKYINDEEPWKLKKTNIIKMNNILHIALEQIAKISVLLNPIIPIASSKVLNALNIKNEFRNLAFLDNKKIINDEVNVHDLEILFKKIV